MKNTANKHWLNNSYRFPLNLFAVVYFFSLECFGCKAHKVWKSETIPLKREILDAHPKIPFFVFTLFILPFFYFIFLSFPAFPTFFLSYYSSEVKQSCCRRYFTPDKLSRCPSFTHSLSFTLLSIHPSSFAPYSCFSWAPFHSIPTPPFALLGTHPIHVCLSDKVSDMSSEAADSVYNKPPSWFYMPWN